MLLYLQDDKIPIYQITDSTNNSIKEEIYKNFYNKYGCLVLKNVFSKELMDIYNQWCVEQKDIVTKTHRNTTHPKQKDKFVINDVLERMSKNNPNLLLKLVNNPILNIISDILLGFSRFGAVTTHWLKEGGDRQLSHTDYPCHIGSGKFWENDPKLIDKYLTKYQLNHILPYFSIQMLIASDAMDQSNGSTECIPGSHLIEDVDKKIFDANYYKSLEDKFINIKLEQGDCFIFNRRLIHRGGKNLSKNKRNSLIMQKVWMFGLGQHQIDYNLVRQNIEKSMEYNKLNKEEKKDFLLRLKHPYPIDTTVCN